MTQDRHAAELRQLKRDLLSADDGQLRRLVALVDRVQDRGLADALLAPLRPRLVALRPARPLGLARLLFLPLDPVIMPPSRWRPGAAGIPRAALRGLAGVVCAGLDAALPEWPAMLAGLTTDDGPALTAAGGRIWPVAGAIFASAPLPAGWTDATGLPDSEFAPLAACLAVLLTEGATLWSLADGHAPADPGIALALLDKAAAAGALPLAAMLALLLARLPHDGELLRHADDLAARAHDAGKLAPDRALEGLLAAIEDATPVQAQAATPRDLDRLRQAAVLLETLVAQSQRRPGRAARLDQVRRQLDDTCREAFRTAAAKLQTPETAAEPAAGLEGEARHLRRMDSVGRRLGGAAFYESTLKQTAERLAATPGMTRVARLRLAEILLGPDAALALIG